MLSGYQHCEKSGQLCQGGVESSPTPPDASTQCSSKRLQQPSSTPTKNPPITIKNGTEPACRANTAHHAELSLVTMDDGRHRATVSKATVNSTRYTVLIPSAGHHGSRFGSCTCGRPDGVPCQHMVVVVKSGSIEGLSRTTAHWQAQYSLEVDCRANVSMTTVKGKYHPNKLLRYCPSWAAANKKGWPKTNQREKSISDLIGEEEEEMSSDVLSGVSQIQPQH